MAWADSPAVRCHSDFSRTNSAKAGLFRGLGMAGTGQRKTFLLRSNRATSWLASGLRILAKRNWKTALLPSKRLRSMNRPGWFVTSEKVLFIPARLAKIPSPMIFLRIPLLILVLVAFNVVIFSNPGILSPMTDPVFSLTLPSTDTWNISAHDLLVIGGVLLLYLEIFKATRTSVGPLSNTCFRCSYFSPFSSNSS